MLPEYLTVLAIGIAAGLILGRIFVIARQATGDPTRRAAAEAPGAESDVRFDQLIRSLAVGVVTLDGRGQIVTLNPAASEIFEIGTRPAVRRALIEVVPSFDLDRRVREALEGRAWRGTISFMGGSAARMLSVVTLPSDEGSGALIIAADETRLHELERTRRDFVSSVSHELRTPLSSINLMIETILAAPEEEEARRLFLPRIKQEIDRMVGLVEDLLELTRTESGQLRLRRDAVDLAALASDITKTFEPRAAKLGIDLRFSGESVFIEGDSSRLAQVLVNLVDNALRHTPVEGAVTVSVRMGENEAQLIVRDTGAGIPYKDLPHVFERFYVVERSRAREAAGTGLGLSIVKGIVEAHGGAVRVTSELGHGASFTCTLPTLRKPGKGGVAES